jgi:hypothetical protein
MQFPLQLRFKIVALAQQMYVNDANGHLLFYVKQKFLKLVESVTVFADEAQSRPLYHINADRILDISARYNITDEQGRSLGALKRHGMRSFWRSHYDILQGDTPVMSITEENPWVKVGNAVFEEIPIVSLFTGYIFNPAYLVTRDGQTVMRMAKQRTFLERIFTIENPMPLPAEEEQIALLSLLMIVMLERSRG